MADAYDILGLTKDASLDEVRTAYRIQAIQTHPDSQRETTDPARFVEVHKAFRTLTGIDNDQSSSLPISVDVARRQFVNEMRKVAGELSKAGYTEEFIAKALIEEGCPRSIVSLLSKNFTGASSAYSSGAEGRASFAQDDASTQGAKAAASGGWRKTKWAGIVLAAFIGFVVFVVMPYQAVEEEKLRRIEAEKEAETQRRLAEEARNAERLAREKADQKEREDADRRFASAAAQSSRNESKRDAALKAEAKSLAQLEMLRAQCESARRTGGVAGEMFGMVPCAAYYRGMKERQYYQSLKQQRAQ